MAGNRLSEAHSLSANLTKGLLKIIRAYKNWDIRELEKAIVKCERDYGAIIESWSNVKSQVTGDINEITKNIGSDMYAKQIEDAFSRVGIQLTGTFPEYQLVPFKLVIDMELLESRLSFGRKTTRISVLEPERLAEQVQRAYSKVVSKRIDSKRFIADLVPTYEIANRLTYNTSSVLWGRAVPLSMIYNLFTLRRASFQDYPKEQFLYDIGRMKEQFGLEIGEYRFELGFARNQSKAMLIVDSQGREHHISSITVYRG